MMTDEEFMALTDARMYRLASGKWDDFMVNGSHSETPLGLYSREQLITKLSPEEITTTS
jgi:hypothetical protein